MTSLARLCLTDASRALRPWSTATSEATDGPTQADGFAVEDIANIGKLDANIFLK